MVPEYPVACSGVGFISISPGNRLSSSCNKNSPNKWGGNRVDLLIDTI